MPTGTTLDVLGDNILGSESGSGSSSDSTKAHETSDVSSRQCKSSVSEPGRTSPPLACLNDTTDSKEQFPTSNKTRMLDKSYNPLWRGFSPRLSGKIHKLHQGERSRTHRAGTPYPCTEEEQMDEEQGNPRHGISRREMLKDLPEIPPVDE